MSAGRPTKRSPEIIAKLEHAFSLGSNTVQACFYAGVSKSAFYAWCEDDEQLKDRLDGLKQTPILKALQTITDDLSNVKTAQWYLERRCDEFKPKSDIKTNDGGFQTNYLQVIRKTYSLEEATRVYEANLKASAQT